ncbi:MAG: glycosyltransferase family 4 protein [Desulfobacterales bacterium]|jgi:glycosyltransferase involved in cell wall biosynthesis
MVAKGQDTNGQPLSNGIPGKRIGFVSTRFAGTDGVTLEAAKWAEVLGESGHRCFWFAGELDRNPADSLLVPEAHFQSETNQRISEAVFGKPGRRPAVTDAIHDLRSRLRHRIHEFIGHFQLDMLIVENALTIPMQIPLGLAIAETIAETQIPTIAHHHDFYWERTRFAVNGVGDYLRMAFPPRLNSIEHVVISTNAQEELAHRKGLSSVVIPNVLDFENPPNSHVPSSRGLRSKIGLAPDDIIILQPTRVVQRKGIEHAIELVRRLENPRCKLVISHEAGDEGYEYAEWLKEDARKKGVDIRFLQEAAVKRVGDPGTPFRHLSLWEIYPHADFITYPSLYEGFGNAFLEAVYFKKPLLINRYAIFVKDIEPQGFDLVVMDGYLTERNLNDVRSILASEDRKTPIVEHNYAVAARHYSYTVLRKRLNHLMAQFFGY